MQLSDLKDLHLCLLHLTQAIQKRAGQTVGVASLAFGASVQNQNLHAISSSFLMQFSAHTMHICA